MRAQATRRVTTTALSLALVLGAGGPAMAAQKQAPRAGAIAASDAAGVPVPDADSLVAQAAVLAELGGVLTPVTDLIKAVLAADDGRLSAEEVAKHAAAIRAAIEAAVGAPATTPQAPAVPDTPAAPEKPAAEKPEAPGIPQMPEGPLAEKPAAVPSAGDDKAASADVREDALAALQKSVDALVEASRSGEAEAVATAVTAVVTGVANLIAATLHGGDLPAADLQGLPSLQPPADGAQTPAVAPAQPES
ncbi:hypothetical protein [Streptomyces sp. NPDC002133]|uniref:hypothetical protein n=1 Tax=Streptomyces sp. NPDC002133 TaxID=3154409 RepID=UPI00333202CC